MKLWKYIYTTLILGFLVVIIALFQLPDGNLHIIACDVGQGDAILVSYKTTQLLTDGGPNSSVLNCLGRHMPFWDRTIELVISSHPDADHSTGLVDVIKRYKVSTILVNPIDPGTDVYQLLEREVGSRGVGVINPIDGQGLRVGMIYLDILNPTEDMLGRLSVKSTDSPMAKYSIGAETNLYSIVYTLSFGKFTGLFPGDSPEEISNQLAVHQSVGSVQYIKVPHHGSKNGLTQNLLEKLVGSTPPVGVISVSAKNIWGFPSSAILDMLKNYNVRVLRTDQMGDVVLSTDGEKYWIGN